MGRIARGAVGIVVGCLAWGPTAVALETTTSGEPEWWVIESADYAGEVKDQIARIEARYTIRVIKDSWMEIPLVIEGAAVTAVEIEKKSGEAHLKPRGGCHILAVSRKGVYRVRVTFSRLLAQDSQFEGVQFGIPLATFSTMSLIVPRKDVELRPTDQLYVETQPDPQHGGVKLTARLGAADRIDLRWRTKPTAPVTMEPVLYGEVHTLVTVEEQLVRLTSIISYRSAQGETKELLIHLPSEVNVLNVRGAGIEDWRVTERKDEKMLTVTLGYALKETTYQLVVEAEQPITEHSEGYTLPEIRLAGVKQERGYLAVSRAGSIELSSRTMEGLNRVDVKELPEPMRAAAGSPVTLAFKYHQHPYRAALALTHHDDHPVLAAIAERGELVTVLSQQGQVLTRASYLIKANKKQFVEVVLPEGATLWSCLVAGKSVKPVEGTDRKLLVPLDATTDATEAVPVELVYFERRTKLTGVGQITLQGPVLDVPTTVANWRLYAPRAITFLRISGNVDRGAAAFDFLEEPFGQTVALAAETPISETATMMGDTVRGRDGVLRRTGALLGQWDGRRWRDRFVASRVAQEPSDSEAASTSVNGMAMNQAPGRPDQDEQFEAVVGALDRLQETGIFPLKIRLPKTGTVYRFNRLMTTQDALKLEATFVHLRFPWMPLAVLGLILIPVGGVAVARLPHR